MINYSDVFQINDLLAAKQHVLKKNGVEISLKQKIPYGTQLYISGKGEEGLINIYYSKKKGFSYVDSSSNGLSKSIISLLKGEIDSIGEITSEREMEEGFNKWIGTDESGKGDFFGPLVVAGFIMSKDDDAKLKKLGVTDSKKLKGNDIHRIAEKLIEDFSNNISVQVFKNEQYNSEYEKFKNLNYLLASGHGKVIKELINNHEHVDGVIADKFADESLIKNSLDKDDLILIQRTKGESNTAVAAASIIARYKFEKEMESLSSIYEIDLPYGAGPNVKKIAAMIYKKWGAKCLKSVVKKHFKTYNEIVM